MDKIGVINILKPKLVTSFQVVRSVRKELGVDKVGHLGTLDPLAIGVLPICVGYATRFADYLSDVDKGYIADIIFGYETDSYDIMGDITNKSENIIPTYEEVLSELSQFIGSIKLTVPAFSAKKIDGVRAYMLARENKIVDAGICEMVVNDIKLLRYSYPNARIKVECKKGTYIRSIIDTLGKRLRCFATMSNLVRIRNGSFLIENSIKLDKFKLLLDDYKLKQIIPVTKLLNWGRAVVDNANSMLRLKNGISLNTGEYHSISPSGKMFFIIDSGGNLLAIGEALDERVPIRITGVFIK